MILYDAEPSLFCVHTDILLGRATNKKDKRSLSAVSISAQDTGEMKMDLTVAVFRFSLLIVLIGNVSSSDHFSKYLFELNVLVLY